MKKLLCRLLAILLATGVWTLPGMAEALSERCPDLAVCDGCLWRIDGQEVCCADAATGETRVALPLSSLYSPEETPVRVGLVSWTGDRVLLALALRDAAGDAAVRLTALGLEDGAIVTLQEDDAGEALGFLADDWYEVSMVGCGQRLFIAAMDSGYQFHFFLYTPDGGALLSLGERSLAAYTAALPYGDDLLIVGPGESDDGVLELTRLSLTDGSAELSESIELDSALRVANLAWDPARERLCYTVNSTVYALTPGSGLPPEVVGTLATPPAELRQGAIVGDCYAALGEQGELLRCDIGNPVTLSAQLRVAAVADSTVVMEAARDFGVAHPGCSVTTADAVDPEAFLAAMEAHSPVYDAFVLPLNGELYRSLKATGSMADLSAAPALSPAVADMNPRMADALTDAGRLVAMPLEVGSSCQQLNLPALKALTGLSEAELPTDWASFLALLGRLADDGALAGGDYCLYAPGMPGEGLRDTLFTWMFQDCLLWVQADGEALDALSGALEPVLRAFDDIDWSRLGAPDALPAPGQALPVQPDDDAQVALLGDGLLTIEVAPQAAGMELWPLSIRPDGPRLIGQAATVICVNPWSANPEAALAFVAHAWERTAAETRMALCQSLNDPTVNDAYDEDLAYMAEDAAMLRQAVADERSADERAYLQASLDELEAYMADYRENARWLTSEESIARYRRFAGALVPVAPDIDFESPFGALMVSYLDGNLTPAQFIDRLPGTME